VHVVLPELELNPKEHLKHLLGLSHKSHPFKQSLQKRLVETLVSANYPTGQALRQLDPEA